MSLPEEWRPIPDYEGQYFVSNLGRVWSEPRWSEWEPGASGRGGGRRFREGRILKPLIDRRGYPKYGLCLDGRSKQFPVHVLVLTAFVGPRPDGMEACHNDGNPANCHLDNLRWDTHGENLRDKVRHGTDFQASKTHCPQGHAYAPENIRHWRGATGRACMACSKAHNRLCRNAVCDHGSSEFRAAADWYYANPGRRWSVAA